jgi:hypothetical protein
MLVFVDTWGGEMEEMSSLWRGVGALRQQSGRQVLPPGGESHVDIGRGVSECA